MSTIEFARQVLEAVQTASQQFAAPELDEKGKRNAGVVMLHVITSRLAADGDLERQKGSRFAWRDGIVLIRNSRVASGFWSNIPESQLDDVGEIAESRPTVMLLCHFDLDESRLHIWAVPAEIVLPQLRSVPKNKNGLRTIFIYPAEQRFHQAANSTDLTPYYQQVDLANAEVDSIAAAIKQDQAAKELATVDQDDDDAIEDIDEPGYSQQTVAYISDLTQHTSDGVWHEKNKDRYIRVLRDPTHELMESLRIQYMQKLDSAVAATKRNLSALKKNDYGKGGYHDHFWAAFYDPATKSKTKGCQLFVAFVGKEELFRFGFALANDSFAYVSNLKSAMGASVASIIDYVKTCPAGTQFRIDPVDGVPGKSAEEFVESLSDESLTWETSIDVVQEFPLDELPERSQSLVDDVGTFFQWVWPFFQAARTGKWPAQGIVDPIKNTDAADDETVIDEEAPATIEDLSHASALPISQLRDIEDALLTKQQVVLTGPPGTSKTYIAQMFARYFVASRKAQAQGRYTCLFMHANWSYEDFFEGIKPSTEDGQLQFASRLGFFLEWIQSLKEADPTARHVLILDEINRCDTASVLGELLQLLEYRERDVRLLSGRTFRLPKNVYIVGTMNSADRSIGRVDLALRRRFLWVELVPNYQVLQTWLSRSGNNPSHFSADSLKQCNMLLADRGIPAQQHVGHALFMVQTFGSDTKDAADKPLLPEALRRIVRFSVLPYIEELCLMQFGRPDSELIRLAQEALLQCLEASNALDSIAEGDP